MINFGSSTYFNGQGAMTRNVAHVGAIKPLSGFIYESGTQDETKKAKRNRSIISAVMAVLGIALFGVPMVVHGAVHPVIVVIVALALAGAIVFTKLRAARDTRDIIAIAEASRLARLAEAEA
jgi:hypothetical protein